MSSSRERVRPSYYKIPLQNTSSYCSPRDAPLSLTDLSNVKQSVVGNYSSENITLQDTESCMDTEDSNVNVKEEFDNGEDSSQYVVVKEKFEVKEDLSYLSSNLSSGPTISYNDSDAVENHYKMPQLSRSNLLSMSSSPLVTATDIVASSSSTVATYFLPSKVPSSVTLTFESSDEEDDWSQSHDPMVSSSGLQGMEANSLAVDLADKDPTQRPDFDFHKVTEVDVPRTSELLLNLETIMNPTPSTSKGHSENPDFLSLHSELCLPLDIEDLKTEIEKPDPDSNIYILERSNITVLPLLQEPLDTMFLEEVFMTKRQFNELLENIYLYHCFQMPGTKSRINLEAVLKFLVRGETIANLAQEYKIAKNTFMKYLSEALDAIFKILGLFSRQKNVGDHWIQTQKRFTKRLGLPNCCGVVNAKTIMTWRTTITGCLPVITLTDADYNIMHVDMEAVVEEQGVQFKTTKLYSIIHNSHDAHTLMIPKLGFVVGNEHLISTKLVSPLYSRVSEDMPIPFLYNKRVERAMRVSENAYGILTSKFRIYDKITTLSPNLAKSVVRATCALHNWLNQTSPGYISPGLVDVETKGDITLGSWRFAHRQIFQPMHLFHLRAQPGRKNKHNCKRDNYAYNLFQLEQMKKIKNAALGTEPP